MMQFSSASALGKGSVHPAGSASDVSLLASLQAYRRRVAGAYRSVKPTEMATAIFGGPFHVSPKVDGELWFLVLEPGDATLVSNHGKGISGTIPLLDEVRKVVANISGRVVLAGELFAASSGSGRPRVGDVASALGGGAKASVERLGFLAFDLVEGLIPSAPQSVPYAQRLEAIENLLGHGKRVKSVKTDLVESAADLSVLFADLVEGGKAEGLVVRSSLGAIYKIKPEFSVDAVILGYTARSEDIDSVRTLLLGLTREDGHTQIIGHCGNLGGDEERKQLMALLRPLECASSFRCPSRSGEMFTFVRPEVVVEIKVTDLQHEAGDGQPIRSMVLALDESRCWKSVGMMPSASLLHPVLVRVRQDKSANAVDTRFAQILERCDVAQATGESRQVVLPASELVRRDVWTKATKGKVAVRKLVAWKTNKDQFDLSFPAFVVHWTDYSAGRGTPLDREVRTAPTKALMDSIADKLIEDNIKKGWEKVA